MTQPDGTADGTSDGTSAGTYDGGAFDADVPVSDDTDAELIGADALGGIDGGTTAPEGQTARDVLPEEEGIPEVSQDDSPTMERSEDPEFAPLPRESAGASADFGTTAFEQSVGESLDDRLARELPDDTPDVRASEDPSRPAAQLEQDEDADPLDDSGTERTGDDVTATGDPVVGGEGPESAAVHLTDG